MKKRSKGGKTVWNPAVAANKILIFFLFAKVLFAQITLNGFCQVNQFTIPEGFSRFKIIDIDGDTEKEVILIGSPEKRFAVINKTGKKFTVAQKFFFYPLSDFGKFNSVQPLGDFYLFASEKKRKIGLTSFTDKGSMILLNRKSLDSYPGKLLIGDVNNDGRNEAVVYGNNFNGLSLVTQLKYKLSENKIIKNKILSSLKFIDLDYDGFPDLAAIDLIANEIVLLMNDNNGFYKVTRSIPFRQNIKNLSVLDFNGDDFTDISFSAGNSVVILFGDSVSSFNRKKTIGTPQSIYEYGFSDFNSDGMPDLIYLDDNKKDCYLKLSNGKEYSQPFLLSGGNVFTEMKIGGFSNSSLQLISPGGRFYGYSKFELTDSVAIKLGGKVKKFYVDDLNFDKQLDFYFIDSYDNTLKTLTGKGTEFFSTLFVDDLVEKHNEIDLFKKSGAQVEFHCYSPGGRLVEILTRDFNGYRIKREAVYSSFPIISVIAHSGSSIAVLERNSDSLLVESFDRLKGHFVNSNTMLIDTNFVGKAVTVKESGSVYYYVRNTKGIIFKKYNPLTGSENIVDLSKVKADGDSVNTKVTVILNADKNESLHITNSENNFTFFLLKNKRLIKLNVKGEDIPARIKDSSNLKIYENNKNKAYIYLYDAESKYVYSAKLLKEKNKIDFVKLFKIHAPSYFEILQLNNKKYFVYSDSLENTINFRTVND